MDQSQVQKKFEEQLAKLAKEASAIKRGGPTEAQQAFSVLIAYMQEMLKKMEPSYVLDAKGKYPDLSPQQREELVDFHNQAIRHNVVCRSANARNPNGRSYDATLDTIDALLAQELNVLYSMNPKAPGSLAAAEHNMSERTVEILDKGLARAGADLSARVPMTIYDAEGKPRKGYFTPATTQTKDSDYQNVLDSLPLKKEFHKRYIGHLLNNKNSALYLTVDIPSYAQQLQQKQPGSFAYNQAFAQDLRAGNVTEDVIDDLTSNADFTNSVLSYAQALRPVRSKYDVWKAAGITDTVDIAKRNIGMTRVANLLGVPDLVAKSMPMKVRNGDKIIPGTFMENAVGIDFNWAPSDSPLYHASAQDVQKATAYKDIADMQVLDYLCGNTDRHLGNFLYKMEAGGTKGHKLTGIMGIDNDCSFGAIDRDVNLMVSPEKMLAISESTANALKKINHETLRTLLADLKFTEGELQAAFARLQTLKACTTIKTLKDHEWNSVDASRMRVSGNGWNLFKMVDRVFDPDTQQERIDDANARERHAQNAQANESREARLRAALGEAEPAKPIQRNAAEELKPFEPLSIFRNNEVLSKLSGDLEKVDPSKIISSSQFRAMKKSLNALRELNEKMPIVITDEYVQRLGTCYKDLQAKTNAYLAYKVKAKSPLAQQRVEMAKQISEFSNVYANAFDDLQRENAQKALQNAHETQERTQTLLEQLKDDKANHLAHTSVFADDKKLASIGKQAHEAYEQLINAAAVLPHLSEQEKELVRQNTAKVLAFEMLCTEQQSARKEGSYGPIGKAMIKGGEQGLSQFANKLMKQGAFVNATPYITPQFAKDLVTGNGIMGFHKEFNDQNKKLNDVTVQKQPALEKTQPEKQQQVAPSPKKPVAPRGK